jgi:hypothetical protein
VRGNCAQPHFEYESGLMNHDRFETSGRVSDRLCEQKSRPKCDWRLNRRLHRIRIHLPLTAARHRPQCSRGKLFQCKSLTQGPRRIQMSSGPQDSLGTNRALYVLCRIPAMNFNGEPKIMIISFAELRGSDKDFVTRSRQKARRASVASRENHTNR